MAQPKMQYAFHTGELAPALGARVDISKYHTAAALMRNFFVDYRGGASSRPGTKYILQCYKSSSAVRLITFQASFTVGYVLEFGDLYIRFFNNGSAVLETAVAITGITKANPAVVTVANTWAVGDWVYITGVAGMTQVNNRYFRISARTAANITLSDLNGTAINSSAYGTWTSGGTAARVYTLPSPYASADLALLKFTQSVDKLILCHPDYVPYVLTLISAANWTINPIVFGTSISAPTNVSVATTLGNTDDWDYAYVVTAVDINGQESAASTPGTLTSVNDLRSAAGTNRITWTAVSGALSYNVYKAMQSDVNPVPAGAAYGFIGNCTGVAFDDSNIAPDFSITPPIAKNPFQGAGVISATVTVVGAYTTVPTAVVDAAPAGGSTATVQPVLGVTIATVVTGGSSFAIGDILVVSNAAIKAATGNVQLRVLTVSGSAILTVEVLSPGSVQSGATPANNVSFKEVGGSSTPTFALTWGVVSVVVISQGAGYTSVPAITFSSGAAAATAVLDEASAGNPSVPGFFQQRLVLAALTQAPQSFHMSQPGSYYNFNIQNPILPDNAIDEDIVSGQLNTIKSLTSMPTGQIMLSDKAAWLVNGGGGSEAITPINATAHAQSYNGASDVPPIVANFDILYVQAKGSIVRDLVYNFQTNVFTGTDISVLSSHLFYSYTITEWAWAEEPYKVVWAVRDDGDLLSLTFMKEQELIGWAKSDTWGDFKSVTVVTEAVSGFGSVDAVYTVVEHVVGAFTVKYIERFHERDFSAGKQYCWCVDSGLRYDGAPATSFTGAEHLAGETVTGLADGIPITPFVMASTGFFTLPSASVVLVGKAFTPQLQTLKIDLGEPTVQGKRKKITAVSLRVQETLGLEIGSTEDNLVPMKDLVIGNVGSQTNEQVTGLVTGDARTVLDPRWGEDGQYFIEQPLPYPASILGVIPEIVVGDTPDKTARK